MRDVGSEEARAALAFPEPFMQTGSCSLQMWLLVLS